MNDKDIIIHQISSSNFVERILSGSNFIFATDENGIISKIPTSSFNFTPISQSLAYRVDSLEIASSSFVTDSQSIQNRVTDIEAFSSSFSSFVYISESNQNVQFNNVSSVTSTVTGDLTVGGTITAQEFRTDLISSSILYDSGSTKFGDSLDDTHEFTGSVSISGSLSITGQTLISSSAQISDEISGSFTNLSSSFQQRISDQENFSSSLNQTFITETDLNSATQSLSSSFSSSDASLQAQINNIEDGTTTITSASYSVTSSHSTTAIYADSALTASYALNGGVTDHGGLLGLTDNDHPQYVLNSETSSMTVATASYVNWNNVGSIPYLISGSDQIATEISGAFASDSSSFEQRITSQEQFSSSLGGIFVTEEELNTATSSLSSSFSQNISDNTIRIDSLESVTSSYITNSQTSSMAVLSSSYSETSSYFNPNLGPYQIAYANTDFGGNSDGTIKGSSGLRYIDGNSTLRVTSIGDTNDNNAAKINLNTKTLTDNNTSVSIRWLDRQLVSGSVRLAWGNSELSGSWKLQTSGLESSSLVTKEYVDSVSGTPAGYNAVSTSVEWQTSWYNIPNNESGIDATSASNQYVLWTASLTPSFTNFGGNRSSVLLEVSHSSTSPPVIDWSGVDIWWTDGGTPPDISSGSGFRVVVDTRDNGTTINGMFVGKR